MSQHRDEFGDDTSRIAGLFAARISAARGGLRERMDALGLTARDGWRIHEQVVNLGGTVAFKLHPVHRLEKAPEDLTVLVRLD